MTTKTRNTHLYPNIKIHIPNTSKFNIDNKQKEPNNINRVINTTFSEKILSNTKEQTITPIRPSKLKVVRNINKISNNTIENRPSDYTNNDNNTKDKNIQTNNDTCNIIICTNQTTK